MGVDKYVSHANMITPNEITKDGLYIQYSKNNNLP